MAQRADPKPATSHAEPDEVPKDKLREAFDTWLDDGLHTLFDKVAEEPVPEELLRLIEDDRKRKKEEN